MEYLAEGYQRDHDYLWNERSKYAAQPRKPPKNAGFLYKDILQKMTGYKMESESKETSNVT